MQPAALKSLVEGQMPEALEILRQMVEINSFTGNREGVNQLGRLTAQTFAPMDFTSEFVPSTNPEWGDHLVLTRQGRSAKNIAMISHLDTVFPPEEERQNNFHWLPEGERIYGPGTQDIKGGTAMMWLVLRALQAFAPEVFNELTWKLIWNSSEEQFSPDFAQVCRSRFDPGSLAALVFEAEGRQDGLPRLVVARKGRGTWRATVNGRGSHAGSKHGHGANAIVQLARIVDRIAALSDPARELTVNVGTITGGTVLNRVPHVAVAEGEFRAFDPEIYGQAKTSLLKLSGSGDIRSLADGYPCHVTVEILTECRPWPRNSGSQALFDCWKRAANTLSLPLESEARGGLSDGNLIWDAIPTIDGLGPWGDHDHCSERSADGTKLPEFVDVSSFVPKAMINVRAILNLVKS